MIPPRATSSQGVFVQDQLSDPTALTYFAKRSVAPQWRVFLRAMMETLETHLEPGAREAMLRMVGARMAALLPLPPCATLGELEARMNDTLAIADWGFVQLSLDVNNRTVLLRHVAAPLVGTHADLSGGWIGAVLEGLYGAWFSHQPGAEPGIHVRRWGPDGGAMLLRYARG